MGNAGLISIIRLSILPIFLSTLILNLFTLPLVIRFRGLIMITFELAKLPFS